MADLLAVLESDSGSAQLPLTLSMAKAAAAPIAPADTPANPVRKHARATDAKTSETPRETLAVAPGAAADPPSKHNNGHAPAPGQMRPAPETAANELRAKALEIVNANVNATLDYARELARVRSPTEFIALSTSHARRRLELMMTHAATLGALSHPFAVRRPDE
jgi:hypothetical protein